MQHVWQHWGYIKFFPSKQACFAFSKFELFKELEVATIDNGIFGFGPIWASNDEIFVNPCGVFLRVFIIWATSDASICGGIYSEFFSEFYNLGDV